MQKSYLLAGTAALALIMQTPLALAQSAPAAGGTPPATAATTTAPAATATPAATTDTPTSPAGSKKRADKKPAKKLTRRQELEHSIDTGTVPERYRSSVPKEYQQYVPFEKH